MTDNNDQKPLDIVDKRLTVLMLEGANEHRREKRNAAKEIDPCALDLRRLVRDAIVNFIPNKERRG